MTSKAEEIDPDLKKALNRLINKRDNIFATVTSIYNKCKSYSSDNLAKVKYFVQQLPNYSRKFEEVQDQIEALNDDLTQKEQIEISQIQASFEEILASIHDVQCNLAKQDAALTTPDTTPNVTAVSQMLPTISLPSFDGKIDNWVEFISLYNSLVHNNSTIDKTQKFQYLKTTLKGEALAVISGLQLIPDNYEIAYEALVQRYQNSRRIASVYFSKLLQYKTLSHNSLSSLKDFLHNHETAVNSIKSLKLPDLADFLLFSIALNNLDSNTKRAFENKMPSEGIPTYRQLIEFVTQQIRIMELSKTTDSNTPRPKPHSSNVLLVNSTDSSSSESRKFACPLCEDSHFLHQCSRYQHMTLNDKYKYLRENTRCFNCLGRHRRENCNSRSVCRYCKTNRHHSSLHPSSVSALPSSTQNSLNVTRSPQTHRDSSEPIQSMSCMASSGCSPILLGTISLLVEDVTGVKHRLRAVYDPGSHISAITKSSVSCLGIRICPSTCSVSGLGQSHLRIFGSVDVSLHSRLSSRVVKAHALVLDNISHPLPPSELPLEVRSRFGNLQLADDDFDIPSPIDFLIGADLLPQLMIDGIQSIPGNPTAVNTVFGWVLVGPTSSQPSESFATSLHVHCNISSTLQKFWETEEVSSTLHLDPLDMMVEEHFLRTHSRDKDGRYIVALPFKPNATPLGSNRSSSHSSFERLERRLSKQPEKFNSYQNFMTEYLNLGHMSIATSTSSYIIPHHAVMKETSSTTKLRVVFNAFDPD